MLDGITIISQTEIIATDERLAELTAILFVAFTLSLIGWFAFSLYKFKISGRITFCIGIICLFASLYFMDNSYISTGKYEYQVTIDESVSLVEFCEEYELIKVENDIYTIREK